jgi:hypothetical protein
MAQNNSYSAVSTDFDEEEDKTSVDYKYTISYDF